MADYNRLWLEVVAEETESVFGGGQQYSYLDLRGRTYPIWVREQGVGRNQSDIITQGGSSSNLGSYLQESPKLYLVISWVISKVISCYLLQIIESVAPGAGGDYHTTYWPEPSFLSSRR